MRALLALLAMLWCAPAAAQPFSPDPAQAAAGFRSPTTPGFRSRIGGPVGLVPLVTVPTGFGTWDPAHNDGLILSNGNATATGPDSTSRMARSTSSNAAGSGLKYFEVKCLNSSVDFTVQLGLGTAATPIGTTGPGDASDQTSYGFAMSAASTVDMVVLHRFGSAGDYTNWARSCRTNDVLAFAVDLTAGHAKVWSANLTIDGGSPPIWNAAIGGVQNPATDSGGYYMADLLGQTVFLLTYDSTPGSVTLNTGGTAFLGTMPAGYTAWH